MGNMNDTVDSTHAEQQLKDIIDAAPDLIHVIAPDMKIINRNATSKKLFPHIKEGDHCYKGLHKRDKICSHCGVIKVFNDQTRQSHESAITLPGGEKIIVHSTSSPIFNGSGDVIAAVEILRDITDRKEAVRALRKSEERFSALFNLASDCILLLDPSQSDDPVIVDANISACNMHGYDLEEMIGKPISFLDTPYESKQIPERSKKLLNGEHLTFETSHLRKDGSIFPVEVSAKIINIGDVPYILAIDRDITKRKKMEERVFKYNQDLEIANQLKDLFTDIMRHDFLNHIGIIRNLSEIMVEEEEFKDSKDLQLILTSSQKLEEMVSAAAAYAKLESTDNIKYEEMDLNVMIKGAEDSLQPYFEGKNISLEHVPEGRYPANTIRVVEEVFVNLLSNAIKYSPRDTKVTVDIEDKGKSWRITVADEGEGIPDEYKEKIFDRLIRRKKEGVKGSGIGLAIVKRIAELHEGAAGVLDNPDGGSTFYFEIPKNTEAQ
jgi:PAS domain S-box-containing protein